MCMRSRTECAARAERTCPSKVCARESEPVTGTVEDGLNGDSETPVRPPKPIRDRSDATSKSSALSVCPEGKLILLVSVAPLGPLVEEELPPDSVRPRCLWWL